MKSQENDSKKGKGTDKKKGSVLSLWLYEFFTATRSTIVVRRLQLMLLGVTVILFTLVLSLPFLRQKEFDLEFFSIGRNAPISVKALYSIEFPRVGQFDAVRKQARASSPLVFRRDLRVLETGYRDKLEEDVVKFKECRQKESDMQKRIACVRQKIPRLSGLSNSTLEIVLKQPGNRLLDIASRSINLLFQNVLIIERPIQDKEFNGTAVLVRDINSRGDEVENTIVIEYVVPREKMISQWATFNTVSAAKLKNVDEDYRRGVLNVSLIYLRQLDPGKYDPDETERLRKIAENKIKIPMYQRNPGDLIVEKGEAISEEIYTALKVHNLARLKDKVQRIAAILIQQTVLICIIFYFSFRFSNRYLNDVSSNLIVFITLWLFIGMLFGLERWWSSELTTQAVTPVFGSWVPIAAFAVLLSVIFGEMLAIPVCIYMSFAIFTASKYDGNSLFIASVMSIAGSILGSRIQKRLHFISTGAILGVLGALLVTAAFLNSGRTIVYSNATAMGLNSSYLNAVQIAFIAGAIPTILVIAFLPLYEALFNIPTRFKLAELADPSHPLLREIFQKAPSTWNHTLMVAALTEKACERLGLNTILARTGIYYHDIGKMANAGFFIENQHLIPKPENVDLQDPAKAAKVIIDHVLDGISMAKEWRLPKEVIAFIPEHHGTSTMSFFYHKALEKIKRRVRRDDFRYPGPIPQTKETAIAMIADSLEAASRSLDVVNEETLDNLINKIVAHKLSENQMDESGLTLGDLTAIKKAFRDVLLSSYHYRPKYPDSADTKKLEAQRQQKKPKKSHAPSKRR